MKIVFMGTPDFSVSVLNALVEAGHEIACVYAQPPRPAGRGKGLRKTPIHTRADELGLLVRTPLNFKDPNDVAEFGALGAEVAVVVAYGLILPQSLLDAPTKGCLNIHASLLPRWRGAAPIQRAIMAGDKETGVAIMQMEAGLDTGPVLLEKRIEIASDETAASLHDRLADLGAGAITQALSRLDELEPRTQSEVGVTYAHKIDKAEAHIDWSRSASEIDRHIRGLSPFPGAFALMGEDRIKFLLSKVSQKSGPAGEALDDLLTIGTGEGSVSILKLQRSGKKAALAEELLRGYPIPKGTKFS